MSIWVIVIAVMLLSFFVQNKLTAKMKVYSGIPLDNGFSGAEIAAKMLADNGVSGVTVRKTDGALTDHFNPSTMTVNLSKSVYEGRSIAAAAIAAHECGHAVQHARGYAPLKLRSALVPVVNFANMTVQWVLLLGVIMINSFPMLLWVGIGLFAMTTLFSFITLPVEVNASRRAVEWLSDTGMVSPEMLPKAADALKWAARTYVIAAIGSLATLIYYITLADRR